MDPYDFEAGTEALWLKELNGSVLERGQRLNLRVELNSWVPGFQLTGIEPDGITDSHRLYIRADVDKHPGANDSEWRRRLHCSQTRGAALRCAAAAPPAGSAAEQPEGLSASRVLTLRRRRARARPPPAGTVEINDYATVRWVLLPDDDVPCSSHEYCATPPGGLV